VCNSKGKALVDKFFLKENDEPQRACKSAIAQQQKELISWIKEKV